MSRHVVRRAGPDPATATPPARHPGGEPLPGDGAGDNLARACPHPGYDPILAAAEAPRGGDPRVGPPGRRHGPGLPPPPSSTFESAESSHW